MYWLARYPNANQGRSSYLFVSDGSVSHLVCPNLTQANGYWQGANLRIRTSDWTYETKTITSSESGGTLRFSNLGYATKAGWGFYLDNKFEQLDVESEWFYDSSTKLLYVYPESASVRTAILQNTAEGTNVDFVSRNTDTSYFSDCKFNRFWNKCRRWNTVY
jgi:hypothetical protein